MKKFTLTAILALSAITASAADYASFDVDVVKDNATKKTSHAQYIRAGKAIDGIQYGLQGRTARYEDGSGVSTSLELTAGKSIGLISPFVGIGHYNGFNGAQTYNYGLVGATTGAKIGSGFALAGVKTRVGTTAATETHQTVLFTSYSVPVAKGISVNLNASKSYQDIKENALGVGVGFSF